MNNAILNANYTDKHLFYTEIGCCKTLLISSSGPLERDKTARRSLGKYELKNASENSASEVQHPTYRRVRGHSLLKFHAKHRWTVSFKIFYCNFIFCIIL